MQDRISTYPGRVKLIPVDGHENTFDMVRADEPLQEGTALNKASLLQDETEITLFGAAADRTVDDAFKGLAGQLKLIMNDTASITLTLKDSAGTAIPGVLVQGILSESGQAVYSDDSGVAAGYISAGSTTLKISNYADIQDYSETITSTKGTSISREWTLTTRNEIEITSSQTVWFSGLVEDFDACLVGGGGGGGGGTSFDNDSSRIAGGGGGGGYVVNEFNVSVITLEKYSVYIGAGGTGGGSGYYYKSDSGRGTTYGGNGGDGGATQITVGGTIILEASGGKKGTTKTSSSESTNICLGGAGNGDGGRGYTSSQSRTLGADGSVYKFNDTSLGLAGGGGGHGGSTAYGTSSTGISETAGSSPYGGDADVYASSTYVGRSGGAGRGPGGGGSGGCGANLSGTSSNRRYGGSGGAGANGACYLRWRFKS